MVAIVVSVTHCYFVLLYSVCNAYLRKLSDKFKCWFLHIFATSIRRCVFTKCCERVSEWCVLSWIWCIHANVQSTTCFKFMKITLINMWQRQNSNSHSLFWAHTMKTKKKQQQAIRMQNHFKSNINMRKCNGDFGFDVVLPVLLKSKKKPGKKKKCFVRVWWTYGAAFSIDFITVAV